MTPPKGKGVALFGLLHIPYIKYCLMHPTGISKGVFIQSCFAIPKETFGIFYLIFTEH